MSLLISKSIFSILSENIQLNEKINQKIYPIFAPDETVNPFIVYDINSISSEFSKDGSIYDIIDFSINIVSDNYSDCVQIADLARKAMQISDGMYSNLLIQSVRFQNFSQNFGVDGFIIKLDFTLKSY